MGTWSHLKDDPNIKEIENSEPGFAELFTTMRSELATAGFNQLSEMLTNAKDAKKELERKTKEASLTVSVIERLIIEKLEAADIDSITAGGYRLTPSPEPSFAKRDGQALRAWVAETGQEDLLTIHSNTLASIVKDYYLEHGEAPPGTELTGTYTKLSRTKAK